jgi:hypothetical protein
MQENFFTSLILISVSTFAMFVVLGIWRRFVGKYADEIIYWTTEKSFFRKLIAGGSFSYYEYKENVSKIGTFEPISRFISLLVAFIGISTSFANLMSLEPSSPTNDLNSALVWSALIFFVPIILTPIIPIIWAMEDLQLKAWNAKFKTNVRISNRYKARFNSIIAIGTLGAAFGISRDPQLDYGTQFINFVDLLFSGVLILTYPIAILTTLYYLYFRGKMVTRIKDKLNLPIAETKLVYRDERGNILSETGEILDVDDDEEHSQSLDQLEEVSIITSGTEHSEEQNIPQKIGSGAKTVVTKTGEAISTTGKTVVGGVVNIGKTINDNTIGRIRRVISEEESSTNTPPDESLPQGKKKKKKKKRGGSATEGLWDKDY